MTGIRACSLMAQVHCGADFSLVRVRQTSVEAVGTFCRFSLPFQNDCGVSSYIYHTTTAFKIHSSQLHLCRRKRRSHNWQETNAGNIKVCARSDSTSLCVWISRSVCLLCFFSFSCGVHRYALYSWGSNEFGQLGIESEEKFSLTPKPVAFRPSEELIAAEQVGVW